MHSKTITLPCLFLVAIMTLFGCRSEAPPETGSEETPASQSTAASAEPRGSQANNRTGDALVQVLIYGLSTLQVEKDQAGTITAITALLPPATDHGQRLSRGRYLNRVHSYEPIAKADDKTDIKLDAATIRLLVNDQPICSPQPCLSEQRGMFTLGDYPKRDDTMKIDQGADVRWLINYDEIEDASLRKIDPSKATTIMAFAAGTLETCALVFPPGDFDSVCRVRMSQAKSFVQSASEYMVIRHPIPANASLKLEIDRGVQKQYVTIPATGGDSVTWNGTTYTKVFDISLANITPTGSRDMNSDHAEMHLKTFFPKAANPWNLDTPDCKPSTTQPGTLDCGDCKTGRQPMCWDYIKKLVGESAGGSDRPICPLVGYP